MRRDYIERLSLRRSSSRVRFLIHLNHTVFSFNSSTVLIKVPLFYILIWQSVSHIYKLQFYDHISVLYTAFDQLNFQKLCFLMSFSFRRIERSKR